MAKRIYLSRGKFALVDDEDYPVVSQYKWSYDKNGYVVRKVVKSKRQKKVMLHRFLLDAPDGMDVDHVNKHKLDNRRRNLRLATRSQNNANSGPKPGSSSIYKGVSWSKRDQRWYSGICIDGQRIHLGTFRNDIDAAKAYDKAAHAAWGEFAFLNFPNELAGAE